MRHGLSEEPPDQHRGLGAEGVERFCVLHQVGGGGGAHLAESIEQAEDEEDQGLVGRADLDLGFGAFEGAVFEGAAEVEAMGGWGLVEGAAEVLA